MRGRRASGQDGPVSGAADGVRLSAGGARLRARSCTGSRASHGGPDADAGSLPWGGRRPRRAASAFALVACLVAMAMGAGIMAAWLQTERGRAEAQEARVVSGSTATIQRDGHTYAYNDDLVTVGFIGFDGRYQEDGAAGQADVVMVVAIDTKTGRLSGVVIPRDSMVSVDAYAGGVYAGQVTQQIALQYAYGDGSEQSSRLVAQAASRVLHDIPINYYLTLNLFGVSALNDAIGGVTLVPAASVPGTDIEAGRSITLLGDDAYQYVHWRVVEGEGSLTSSLDRQKRQVQYFNAFMAQAMGVARADSGLLDRLYGLAMENGWSDLGASEYAYLSRAMLTSGISGIDVRQLSGEMRKGELYSEYYLDDEAVLDVVLDVFYRQVD